MLEKLVGYKIALITDSKTKIEGKLVEAGNILTLKTEGGDIYHVIANKVELFRLLEVEEEKIVPNIYIYACKNDELGCKGVKFLSCNKMELKDVDCDCKLGCDFGLVGNLYDLPRKIQVAFLHGMNTGTTPIKVKKKKEMKNANGKRRDCKTN